MKFIKILLLTFFIVFGMGVVSLSAQQENVCYLAVSVKDQSTIEEKAEEVFREIKIEMKFSNGMQKNWEQIAKELKFDSVKQMINVHKEDKNWNKYKEVFNKPQKFDQAIFLIKKKTENEFEKIFKMGLAAGADVHVRDPFLCTPLHEAVQAAVARYDSNFKI